MTYYQLLIPLMATLVLIASHAVLCRLQSGSKTLISLCQSFLVGLIFLLFMQWKSSLGPIKGDVLSYAIANLITYIGMGYCYYGLVNLGVSLRIRILSKIGTSNTGKTYANLEKVFEPNNMMKRRLQRLLESSQVDYSNNIYYAKDAIIFKLAALNRAFKTFYLGSDKPPEHKHS